MKKFKRIYVEITNRCNLSCDFCPKTARRLETMDIERFKIILKKIKPHTDYIYLHLMGEPCLHPQLEVFLEEAFKEGIQVNLTTNGTLIHKVKDALLKAKSLRQVNFSLHSFEANESGMTLEDYVAHIADFMNEAALQTKLICAVRLWNMDSEELQGANALNHTILELLEKYFELECDLAEVLLEKRQLKLRDRQYLNMAEKFEWPDEEKELMTEDVFCYGLRDHLGVLVDGTVVPCCLDSEGGMALGNLLQDSLETILKTDRAKGIYEGFSRRKAVEELCKRCGYAKRH